MNQPEQPIEALLDEVDSYCAAATDESGRRILGVRARTDLPRLSRELRQRIEREQEIRDELDIANDALENQVKLIADLRQQLEQQQRLPICSKCQQGYVCEYCGDPIGDYYAGLGVKRVEQQQQQSESK